MFARPLPKTSSIHLQDVFKTSSHDVFKTSSRRLQDVFQDIFKTPSRCLQDVPVRRLHQDVFKTSSRRLKEDVLQLCLQDVFKTSSKIKKCYAEDVFKTSLRCLQYVFIKTNVCWVSSLRTTLVKKICNTTQKHI